MTDDERNRWKRKTDGVTDSYRQNMSERNRETERS